MQTIIERYDCVFSFLVKANIKKAFSVDLFERILLDFRLFSGRRKKDHERGKCMWV